MALSETKTITVALLGNPNTGKSTIFNVLSGTNQKTGNYPGVTIEKRVGHFSVDGTTCDIVDLPGTYSLAPQTPDEMLSVNVLLGKNDSVKIPDVIVCVVDASNLERNLFLTSQLLELHRPTVVALNMTDIASRQGVEIDVARLSKILGVQVVPILAKKQIGIEELKKHIVEAVDRSPSLRHDPFLDEIKERIERLENACPTARKLQRFALTRMLFDTDGYMIEQMRDQIDSQLLDALVAEQEQMKSDGTFAESESNGRYNWIQSHLSDVVRSSQPRRSSTADSVDRWLTNPFVGLIIAAAVMLVVFQLVFWAAEPASNAIDWLTGLATTGVDSLFVWLTGSAEGAFHSLLVDGLIAGVGGVLVFLPQIMLLFLILAILEDSGYLARLAFLTDKFLSKIGLSGITLIPLLSSFACAIPGIMATRVIKNERERLITILIAPLMSCSARLPVYTLLIAAFVPSTTYFGIFGLQGLTMFAMYMIGIVVAIAVAWILKKTWLKTGTSTFVMELPTYKIPSLRNVWHKVYEGGSAFVKDAGTIIVAATIIVWAAAYFPRSADQLPDGLLDRQEILTAQLEQAPENSDEIKLIAVELNKVENEISAAYMENSFLGRAGQWVEPAVRPLGWDWRIGSAAIASFPAREVIVSTMGVLFGLGEVDEESESLKDSLKNATWANSDKKLFSLPVALSIMVFFALCAQCSSTLAVIKRETNSWFWPVFTFAYMTGLAYIAALLTYQVSNAIVG